MPNPRVVNPAPYVSSVVVDYVDQSGNAQSVSQATPMPVAVVSGGGGGGGSTPTGPAGTPNAAVVSVQGVSGGTGVPVLDAFQPTAATNWSSATAANAALAYSTAGYDTVVVEIDCAAGITGGQVVFEVSSGTSWKAVKAANISGYTTSAGPALAGGQALGFQVPVAGFPQFRVRLANAIKGNGNVTISVTLSSAPDVSLVTVGLDPSQPLPAGGNTIGTVLGPLAASPVVGQQTLTTSAAALPSNALQNSITLQALRGNTGTVYVGGAGVTANTGYPLAAGASVQLAVSNTSGVYILGTVAGDKAAFAGN